MPAAMLLKQIKAARFKDDGIKRAVRAAIERSVSRLLKDFESTVETWEHKPKFRRDTSYADPEGPFVMVSTDDKVYAYVNNGTKPHEIWAGAYTGKSDKRVLAFPSAFQAKTEPRVIGSGPGMKGDVDTFRAHVHHPGTEAREFTRLIEEKWSPWFKKQMEQAMREGAKASGHGR